MLFQQFPIWIDLEAPLLSVRSDDDFVVPLAIGVVFPFYPNDLTASRLLADRLLDGGGERLHLDHFPGLLSYLRGHTTSETDTDHCFQEYSCRFHISFSLLGSQTVVPKNLPCQTLHFCHYPAID